MMSTTKVIVSSIAAAGLLFTAQVQAREFADIYTECGIGAMIAPNNEAVAAVTNVTWDLGTTAILSNASSADSCEGGSASSASMIYQTYPALEKDLANGAGEHLTALLLVAGVEKTNHASVIDSLRLSFADVVSNDDYSTSDRFTKSETLFNLLYASI